VRSLVAPSRGRGAEAFEDAALVARVAERDGTALEALYDRYGRACYSLARRVVADDTLAEDVVQEVFLTVWRDASRFERSRGALAGWLLSIAHNKAVDVVRREENHRRRNNPHETIALLETPATVVHDEVWSGLRRDRVLLALDELPAAQREALALAYFGGYTQREIAGITSTPLGTVKTRMLLGMRRLRESLEGVRDGGPDGGAGGGPDRGPNGGMAP
jgi:RNA polymerase sigma factor (sigma-70 family)